MKWIGQHIWDFISRFRSDVYLEDLTESAQDHVVGVDADGKLYKQDVSVGDITGVTAGDALTGGGDTGAITINHEDTSSQASVDNSGSTFIQDVTLDTYGHVTGLTSTAVPTLNQDTTGQAGTVATIAGLAPNTATTQATQPNITTMTGFVTGSANQLITDDGDGTVTSESGLKFTGNILTLDGVNDVKITSSVNGLGYSPDVMTTAANGIALSSYNVFGTGVGGLLEQQDFTSGSVSGAATAWKGGGSYGTNKPGGDMHVIAGRGTGSQPGGSFKFWSSPAGGSGSSYNTSAIKFIIDSVGNITSYGNLTFVGGGDGIIFEGTTPDDHETTFVAGEPTADRTITLPDATGTVALTSQLDHDALTNFVANEHLRWDNDVSATATIHASNIPTLNQDTSGTAATVTGAAQTNITSLGTLTNLQVDDVNINTKSIEILGDTGDTFNITTGAHGGTTMTTVDAGASNGHISLIADGSIKLRTTTGNILIQNPDTSIVDGQTIGKITFSDADGDYDSDAFISAIATEDHDDSTPAVGTKLEFRASMKQDAGGDTLMLTLDPDDGATFSVPLNSIQLGHASDTTIARSAAGIATIEGKQIFTTNIPALTSGAAGVPAVTMQTRRTITTAEANSMNSTPIELVPAQGANTVIMPLGGLIRVDRAATQTNSSADLNMHYAGLEPGAYFSTSLAHLRRFMWNETGDRVFSITAMILGTEIAQNLTSDANKALEVSFDAATTTDCFTSIDIFLTYQVISIA